MKYLQPSFTVPEGGKDYSAHYEQTFVVCHCMCHPGSPMHQPILHDQACCWPCDACGVNIRIGMEKRHTCRGRK